MKLQISKTALEMAVKNICRVINTKNALPILGDVLCMVDEQQQTITMTGSDTEAWLTYQLALQGCEGGGRFCIGADLLRDALSELPEQPVTIHFTDPSRAVTIQPDDPLYQGEEITMLLMPMLVND